MISMEEKQKIIKLWEFEGKSIRQISQEVQLNRKTVTRYLRDYQRLKMPEEGSTSEVGSLLSEYLLNSPSYDTSSRVKVKLVPVITEIIDSLLEDNETRISTGLKKQCYKSIDIHEHLLRKGLDISYSSVSHYVSQYKSKQKEAFSRQHYAAGEECEFDWGKVRLYINGQLRDFRLGVFTMCYSNYRYAYLFQREDTLAFMESHVLFFQHLKGSPKLMVYDNMKVAVSKFVTNKQKLPTVSLLQMESYYGFDHRFCNVRKGNEKGHVEKSVEFIRRRVFSQKLDFTTLEEANTYLQSDLLVLNQRVSANQTKNKTELLSQERSTLLSHRPAMECFQMVNLKVDKWSTICLYTNHYSVPDYLVGERLDVKIYSNHLLIYHKDKQVCKQEHTYKLGQWIMKLEHYLHTFKTKPGAISGSLALSQSDRFIQELYNTHFKSDDNKGFIELLNYCKKNEITMKKLEETCIHIQSRGLSKLGSDSIIAVLGNSTEQINASSQSKNMEDQEIEHYSKIQLITIANLLNKAVS